MSRVIVLGGGPIGPATALMTARQGDHEVTVLERDPAPLPETPGEAWESWERDGVTEITAMLASPQEVLARPGLAARIRDGAAGQSVTAPPGPSRAEVLEMLS